MKRIISLIGAIGLGLFLVACDPGVGGNGNGDGDGSTNEFEAPFSLSAVVVEIPAAISADSSGTASWIAARATDDELFDQVSGVYNPIRDNYNPLAETILAYADDALSWVDDEILSIETRMETLAADGEISGTSSDELFTVHVALSSTDGSDTYTIRRWDRETADSDTWEKTLHVVVAFDTTNETVSGTVYGAAEPADTTADPIEFSIEFDNSDADLGMVVTARAVNLEGNVTDSDQANKPSRIWMTANASETGVVFNMAANIRYIDVDLEPVTRDGSAVEFSDAYMESVANLGEGTFDNSGDTAYEANYVYRAVVETTSTDTADETYGKVDLALVYEGYDNADAGTGTTELFESYAIGEHYTEAMRRWVLGTYLSTINGYLSTNSYSADGDLDSTLTTSSTSESLIAALNWIKDDLGDSSDATLDEILDIFAFISRLVNPGYFDGTADADLGEDFFTGTDEYPDPDANPDDVPDWFATLDDNDFAFNIEVFPGDMVPPATDGDADPFYGDDVAMPNPDEAPDHL